jgi:hypothetical protein
MRTPEAFPEKRRVPVDFALNAFGVRCVLTSPLAHYKCIRSLLTRPRHRNNEVAVLLRDEVFACAG